MIPHYLRRDYRKKKKNYDWIYAYIASLFFISAVIFFITTVFHLTDVAKADTSMSYENCHTEHEACGWLKSHPGKVKNVSWCNL